MTHAIPRSHGYFGKFIRGARLRAGMSQRTVSLKLKYSSAQFISNFECGISLPPLEKIDKLIELYSLDRESVIKTYMKDYELNLKAKLLN